MKGSQFRLLLIFLAFTCTYAMCSKEDASGNNNTTPDIQLKKGFLVTIGINGVDMQDTINLRYTNLNSTPLIGDYSSTAVANGAIRRPTDFWEIVTAGNNRWYLKSVNGQYLEYREDNKLGISQAPREQGLFRINMNGDNFSIESVAKPGYYFKSVAYSIQPPDPHIRPFTLAPNPSCGGLCLK